MSKWAQLDIDDKRAVVGSLIKVIKAGENSLEIEWEICTDIRYNYKMMIQGVQ